MKKSILIISTLLMVAGVCSAQNEPLTRTIRVAYGYMAKAEDLPASTSGILPLYTGSAINVDADLWRLSSNISMGFHAGIGGAETSLVSIFPLPIGFHYGINLHYHVLPQLGDLPGHWDIVLNSEVGSYTCPHLSPQLEYGFGATFTYYPFTHWGIFVEGTWGRFCYNQLYNAKVETGRSLLEAGLSLRF